jgi:hypothetical protein
MESGLISKIGMGHGNLNTVASESCWRLRLQPASLAHPTKLVFSSPKFSITHGQLFCFCPQLQLNSCWWKKNCFAVSAYYLSNSVELVRELLFIGVHL